MLQLALSSAHLFHNGTDSVRRNVCHHALNRLVLLAVNGLEQGARCTYLKFVALAAQVLNQNGQMHLAAACYAEGIRVVGLVYAQRYVLEQLAVQTLTQLTGGDKLALAAGKRRIVDGEIHFYRRLGNLNERQRLRVFHITQRIADGDVFNTGYTNNVAGRDFIYRCVTQAVNGIHGYSLCLVRLVVMIIVANHQFLTNAHRAALHATDGNAANIIAVVNRGYQHLQRAVGVHVRCRNVLQNGLEQRGQIFARRVRRQACRAVAAGAVQNRAVQLLIRSVQRQQQFQNLIADVCQTGIRTINLIDNNNNLVTKLQRLFQNETGLWHRALKCIDQQDNTVNHLQDTLDLAGEVGVTRGVYNIDLRIFIMYRSVLCQNRNAALTLQIVAVHDALLHYLIGTEGTALLQHLVDQRCLAVVNVRDDCDVS